MLRAIGADAAVLDGGLAVWPGPLQTGNLERPAATFAPRRWPAERITAIEEVVAAVERDAGRRTSV